MYKLQVGSIPIPDIVVAKDKSEAAILKTRGLPYIIWNDDEQLLIKLVMYQTLKRMFPHILWNKVLGVNERYTSYHKVTQYRSFSGTSRMKCETPIEEFVGDMSAYVNVEELQSLKLLPQFMSDIATNITSNLFNNTWTEGYNKKLGVPIGNFNAGHVADNLIILDISGSIPGGIAATMLALINTIKDQTNADLIITGSRSLYYAANDKLPDPRWIRRTVGRDNERDDFFKILEEKIKGRHFGNIISFGDNDCPFNWRWRYGNGSWDGAVYNDRIGKLDLTGTKVEHVHHYHTTEEKATGYALWVKKVCPDCVEHFDTDWANVMWS